MKLAARLRAHLSLWVLGASCTGLLVGGAFHWAGAVGAGWAWMASGWVGGAYALEAMLAGLRRRHLGVDLIALLAVVGALAVGEDLAAAVIAVMLSSGRALEDWASQRAKRDLTQLLQRAPKSARRYGPVGLAEVELETVRPGDRLMVATGDLVPVDGRLLSPALLDEAALTGEPLPVDRAHGDAVRSGVVNAGAPFDMEATTDARSSTYSGVVRLVSQAESSRAPSVRLADRFAAWFLPLTLVAAGAAWTAGGATRAVAVLVVATPCPLILAVPVAIVAGLSRSSRLGVVMKGGAVLERLAACSTLLLDKTGTLTLGQPRVERVRTLGNLSATQVLQLAGALEQGSSHVLARAISDAARREGPLPLPAEVEEVPGSGIRGRVGRHQLAVGKAAWVGFADARGWVEKVQAEAAAEGATAVFVASDARTLGAVLLTDPLRPDAAQTTAQLRRQGMARIVLLTGDRAEAGRRVGAAVGVDQVYAQCSPADKLAVLREEAGKARTVMVGDGINDAPALAAADVGVAMGARGASVASEAADAVLLVDQLAKIGEAHSTAVRTRQIALESVLIGMGMSLLAMAVAGAGYLPAVWGATLQEGIDVLVILNALRALGEGRRLWPQPHGRARTAAIAE